MSRTSSRRAEARQSDQLVVRATSQHRGLFNRGLVGTGGIRGASNDEPCAVRVCRVHSHCGVDLNYACTDAGFARRIRKRPHLQPRNTQLIRGATARTCSFPQWQTATDMIVFQSLVEMFGDEA